MQLLPDDRRVNRLSVEVAVPFFFLFSSIVLAGTSPPMMLGRCAPMSVNCSFFKYWTLQSSAELAQYATDYWSDRHHLFFFFTHEIFTDVYGKDGPRWCAVPVASEQRCSLLARWIHLERVKWFIAGLIIGLIGYRDPLSLTSMLTQTQIACFLIASRLLVVLLTLLRCKLLLSFPSFPLSSIVIANKDWIFFPSLF